MQFTTTAIDGAWLIDLDRHDDDRGSFARTFCEAEFAANGLPVRFPQCNLSINRARGTMRGMHYNVTRFAESKLVRCVRGAIFDVAIDLRGDSPTRHRWIGFELSADNGRALFLPEGMAHGFLTLADDTDIYYHMGSAYQPDAARGFRWNDPRFAVSWPEAPTVISERDATYPDYADDYDG